MTIRGDLLWRNRKQREDRRERFLEYAVELGWHPWSESVDAPAHLGLAAGWSDSDYSILRNGALIMRSGERTVGLGVRASRTIGWATLQGSVMDSNRFFKMRRIRLDYLAVGTGMWLRPAGWPAAAFGETLWWEVNPDYLRRPWSAGIGITAWRPNDLTVFVTNTYGSTMPNVYTGPDAIVVGFRLTAEVALRRKGAPPSRGD